MDFDETIVYIIRYECINLLSLHNMLNLDQVSSYNLLQLASTVLLSEIYIIYSMHVGPVNSPCGLIPEDQALYYMT